ncbi:hypothetical protein UZ36_05880 [Candidatus Nitromaritima sp. SCGC AAA799-C22]|nr:hypothetical protein UZ36_05880 [Candidatus Nitromaritima sp. SCGC AAA799-C22]
MNRLNPAISFCLTLSLIMIFPLSAFADCEGIAGPARFSLYKNRQATFKSVVDAGYKQQYKVEWFVGSRSLGSVTKNGGETFILEGSSQTSLAFAITGQHEKDGRWHVSHYKIFPDREGGIQVRFEDGSCDNSFVTSPDLKVIITID